MIQGKKYKTKKLTTLILKLKWITGRSQVKTEILKCRDWNKS